MFGGAAANSGTSAISAGGFLASGGVFSGGVKAFATGGLVNRPTLFPMKRGMGLMGEAGPEAILPVIMRGARAFARVAGGGAVPLVRDRGILTVGGFGPTHKFATGGIVMPTPYAPPAHAGGAAPVAQAAAPLTVNMNIHIAGDATDATVEKFRGVAVGEIQRAMGPIVDAAVAKTRGTIRRDPTFSRR